MGTQQKAIRMLLSFSFISALAGVGFAIAAALLPDTGIDGTLGALLALLGAVAVTFALGLLVIAKVPARALGLFKAIAVLLATLTALAAWFLMQNGLLATMVLALLALLVSGVRADRKISK